MMNYTRHHRLRKALAIGLLGLALSIPASTWGQTALRLSPTALSANPGDVVSVEVLLSTSALEITLVQFSLDYDSTVVHYEGLSLGTDLVAANFFVQQETLDPVWSPTSTGTNRNLVVQLYGGAGNSVAGDNLQAAVLSFRVSNEICGASPLSLDPTCPRSELVLLRPVVAVCSPDLVLEGSQIQSTCVGMPTLGSTSAARLLPNTPNPFNPVTIIPFDLARDEHVRLAIYRADGSHVMTLVNTLLPSGRHDVLWDGKNARGSYVPSGVYYSRLITDRTTDARPMVLIK